MIVGEKEAVHAWKEQYTKVQMDILWFSKQITEIERVGRKISSERKIKMEGLSFDIFMRDLQLNALQINSSMAVSAAALYKKDKLLKRIIISLQHLDELSTLQ